MVKIAINANEQQLKIWNKFKEFVKTNNFGSTYGVFSNNLFCALENFLNDRARRVKSIPKKNNNLFEKNEKFLAILSIDDKRNIYDTDHGMVYERFYLLLGKIYDDVSESVFRDKIKETIRMNDFVLVEDSVTKNKYIYSRNNIAGIESRKLSETTKNIFVGRNYG
jgi:hypothetical protein